MMNMNLVIYYLNNFVLLTFHYSTSPGSNICSDEECVLFILKKRPSVFYRAKDDKLIDKAIFNSIKQYNGRKHDEYIYSKIQKIVKML